jgi:phosphatidylserine/phosphatidylglycerophosphate/cardiolipin synthase-like enzyme
LSAQLDDYFDDGNSAPHTFNSSIDNDVTVYSDTRAYFADILKDLAADTEPEHFVYFAGWWTDIDIPLGDPKAQPLPASLRQALTKLAAGTPGKTEPNVTPATAPEPKPGPQICCMAWQQKGQIDWSLLASLSMVSSLLTLLPDSIFGAYILGSINTACVKFVASLPGNNASILDKRTRMFGSHHQKYTVILNGSGLVAYIGSSDFNADRLYPAGDQSAVHPPTTKGAPLNDVNVRITGPAAYDVLKSFVDRWRAHPEGKDTTLQGATYAPSTPAAGGGGVTTQVTHTYGDGYPFKDAVRSAADAQLKLMRAASQYIYFEDQYMIGTAEIGKALDDQLKSQSNLVVIAVMAPLPVVDGMKGLVWRRSDFWWPLYNKYGPTENDRVLLFEMLNDNGQDNGPGAYLHNKMTIVDDAVATVGSVNFSNRSATHDSEIMISFGGTGGSVPVDAYVDVNIARKVRLMRWSRHLNQSPQQLSALSDAYARWRKLTSNHVRPWAPQLNTLDPVTYQAYLKAYSSILDPA